MYNRLTGLVFCLVVGCSASNQIAEPLEPPTLCKGADEHLAVLLELVDQDELQGLKDAISNDLTADLRTRLIDLLFDVVDSFPPGTFSGLKPVSDTDSINQLLEPIGTALKGITQSTDTGYKGLARTAVILNKCHGAPLVNTLDTLLGDIQFREQIEILLSPGSAESILNSFSIDFADLEGKAGFQALMYGLLKTIAQPGFAANEVTDIIDSIASDDPSLTALSKLLGQMLATGPYLEAVQSVAHCILKVDPEEEFTALVYEILRTNVTDQLSADEMIRPYPDGILGTLDHLVRPIIHLLATDNSARASLVSVSAALLREETARKFLPDAIVLIEKGVVADIIRLLVALSTKEC